MISSESNLCFTYSSYRSTTGSAGTGASGKAIMFHKKVFLANTSTTVLQEEKGSIDRGDGMSFFLSSRRFWFIALFGLFEILLLLGFNEAMISVGPIIARRASHFCFPKSRQFQSVSNWDDFMGSVEDLLSVNTKDIVTPDSSHDFSKGDWCTIHPRTISDLIMTTQSQTIKSSPVEEKWIDGRRVFIKRDDLLRLPGSQISGNKARKMFFLNQLPASHFPSCIVSYGGPQSNSMLALAAVVNYKNREELVDRHIRFVYYTKTLPRFLRKQASGNLFRALTLGMEIVELTPKQYQDFFDSDWGGSDTPPLGLTPPNTNSLWVPQGGAFELAVEGANRLAHELTSWWIEQGDSLPLSVVFPGGTCTTALLVHHALQRLNVPIDMEVVVVPCVGDATYAQRQMMSLCARRGMATDNIPHILAPWPEVSAISKGYFPFGEPDPAILNVFNRLKDDNGLVLDLVYGAPAWTILLRHWHVPLSSDLSMDPRNPIAGREVMYVHSGGLEGINSQLLRYKYKGLVELKDIQLP